MQIYNAMAIDREGRDNGNMMGIYIPTAAPVFPAIYAICLPPPRKHGMASKSASRLVLWGKEVFLLFCNW